MAHRDIKPDNVLCTKPSQLELGNGNGGVALMHVKLADFGLSATFDPDAGGASFYGCVGTAEYMAPELVLELQRLRKLREGGAPDPDPNPHPHPHPHPHPDPNPNLNPEPNPGPNPDPDH